MKKQIILTAFYCLCLLAFSNIAFSQGNNNEINETVKAYKQFLSGTLLVNNFETSYTSTYIEIDLCPSGYFLKTVNGSFSTGSYRPDKPHGSGASSGNYSGTWKVTAEQGVVYLILTDQDGPGYYELGWNDQYANLFLNGTKWPYQQGGARCQ